MGDLEYQTILTGLRFVLRKEVLNDAMDELGSKDASGGGGAQPRLRKGMYTI